MNRRRIQVHIQNAIYPYFRTREEISPSCVIDPNPLEKHLGMLARLRQMRLVVLTTLTGRDRQTD